MNNKDNKNADNDGRYSAFRNKKKKTIIIGISVIVAIAALVWGTSIYTMNSMSSPASDGNGNENPEIVVDSNIVPSSASDTVVNESQLMTQELDEQLFCGNQTQGPSVFVKEFDLPVSCSQPLGLAVDKSNNIWIASGKTGNLYVFDPRSNTFNNTIPIPNWPVDREGQIGSMMWDLKFDNKGDLWFTDQRSDSIWR